MWQLVQKHIANDMIRLFLMVPYVYIKGGVTREEVRGKFEKGDKDVSGKCQTPC